MTRINLAGYAALILPVGRSSKGVLLNLVGLERGEILREIRQIGHRSILNTLNRWRSSVCVCVGGVGVQFMGTSRLSILASLCESI